MPAKTESAGKTGRRSIKNGKAIKERLDARKYVLDVEQQAMDHQWKEARVDQERLDTRTKALDDKRKRLDVRTNKFNRKTPNGQETKSVAEQKKRDVQKRKINTERKKLNARRNSLDVDQKNLDVRWNVLGTIQRKMDARKRKLVVDRVILFAKRSNASQKKSQPWWKIRAQKRKSNADPDREKAKVGRRAKETANPEKLSRVIVRAGSMVDRS